MPTQFFTNKQWQEALISVSLSNNTTAALSYAQESNLISPNHEFLPLGIGGLVGIASEIGFNGTDISFLAQLLGTMSFLLNYMLPEYLAVFFDADKRLTRSAIPVILTVFSFFLASRITSQPELTPKALTTPPEEANFNKKKCRSKSTKKDEVELGQQEPTITSTDPQDLYKKEARLIKQTKDKIDSQHALVVSMRMNLLNKIKKSQDYLNSKECRVDNRKREALIKSNLTKKTSIETNLKAQEEKITLWNKQLEPVLSSAAHLEKLSSMSQEGQTLLTNLSDTLSNFQNLDQVLDEQLQFELNSIRAWEKKPKKFFQNQTEPLEESTPSMRLN